MFFGLLLSSLALCLGPVEGSPQPAESTLQTPRTSRAPQSDTSPQKQMEPNAPDRETSAWLVHLAQHQGHLVGKTDPRRASWQIISLLDAATQTCPDFADAYYWLFDLNQRMGRTEEARQALQKYTSINKNDEAAAIRCLEMELAQRQTGEERADFVRGQIKLTPLSPAYESELHGWLGRHYFEQRETESAAREVENALRLNPLNVAARELAYEMFGETEPVLQRVEMALQLISINPTQTNLLWELGELLDQNSMHTRAQEWYNRAIEMHQCSKAGPVPPEYWHQLAISYLNSRDFKMAKQAADEALRLDPNMHTARLLRSHALNKMGENKKGLEDIDFVRQAYKSTMDEVVASKDYKKAAEIAWFFTYHDPQPTTALKMANLAMEEKTPSELAKVSYGYALSLNGRPAEAIKVLKPLAQTDQLAAYELSQLEINQGDKSQGISSLHKAATIQYSGIGYNLICDLLESNGETPPQRPVNAKVIAALDKFKRDVFDYARRPTDFLKVTAVCMQKTPLPQGPIDVKFRIENIGPFTISFGEGYMARPLAAVSAKIINGERSKSFDNYYQILLNARPMLLPGDAIEKVVAIDVGPFRDELIRTATKPVDVEVAVLFDPVFEQGKLVAGSSTITVKPIKFQRPGIDISDNGIAMLKQQCVSPDYRERISAAQEIGALFVTAFAEKGTITDKDFAALRQTFAGLFEDADWRVRAHAIEAIGWSKLDQRMAMAASTRVRDENDVVRALASKLFADQHGEKFYKVLEQFSKNDPCSYVRMMASSYLPTAVQAKADSVEDNAEMSSSHR